MAKLDVKKKRQGLRLYKGRWPSVTTVLKVIEKSYLDAWRSRVGRLEADKVMRDSQAFGTRVHAIADKLARGEDPEIPEGYEPYAQAVRDFLDKWVAEVHGTEMELISTKRRFAGTLDLYCTLKDGSKAVVDLKTTRSLTRDHGLQTAAYTILLIDNGYEVHRRLVVRIKKEDGAQGKYHVREYKDHKEDAEAFLAVLTVFYWQKGAQIEKLIKEGE